jgi:hypothetical protein
MRFSTPIALLALFVSPVIAQPVLDGDLSDAQYTTLATKQNSNAGFGPDADVQRIVYFADDANATLYLGVVGRMPTGNDNGIGIFLGTNGGGAPTGVAAGNPLGFPGAGHYMDGQGGGTDDDFAADFEVDYMFAMNSGSGSTSVFLDAASHIGGQAANFVGQSPQDGSAPGSGVGPEGQTITFAFNNTGGANTGFEAAIPFSELGASAASDLQAFAFIVSSSGFFSDVTVPGNVTTGNPGFNANFNTLSGGPYNSMSGVLPVELTSFVGAASGGRAALRWQTASETNNSGFEVQMRSAGTFAPLTFVEGAGTTLEAQSYAFTTETLAPGTYAFRLRQIDLDGAENLSHIVEVTIGAEGTTLAMSGPNPFSGSTALTLTVDRAQRVEAGLYDLLGRRVASLHSGAVDGSVVLAIDGSGLPAGLYVVRAQGETFRTSRGLTLTR